MFIIYSKQTGNIISATGSDLYTTIKDMYPVSYIDYEIVYDCMNISTDEAVLQDINGYRVDLETKEIVPVGTKRYTIEELMSLGLLSEKDLYKLR